MICKCKTHIDGLMMCCGGCPKECGGDKLVGAYYLHLQREVVAMLTKGEDVRYQDMYCLDAKMLEIVRELARLLGYVEDHNEMRLVKKK